MYRIPIYVYIRTRRGVGDRRVCGVIWGGTVGVGVSGMDGAWGADERYLGGPPGKCEGSIRGVPWGIPWVKDPLRDTLGDTLGGSLGDAQPVWPASLSPYTQTKKTKKTKKKNPKTKKNIFARHYGPASFRLPVWLASP